MFIPHDAIDFVKCTSFSYSKTIPQNYTATPMHHSWDGARFLFISPNLTIMAK